MSGDVYAYDGTIAAKDTTMNTNPIITVAELLEAQCWGMQAASISGMSETKLVDHLTTQAVDFFTARPDADYFLASFVA